MNNRFVPSCNGVLDNQVQIIDNETDDMMNIEEVCEKLNEFYEDMILFKNSYREQLSKSSILQNKLWLIDIEIKLLDKFHDFDRFKWHYNMLCELDWDSYDNGRVQDNDRWEFHVKNEKTRDGVIKNKDVKIIDSKGTIPDIYFSRYPEGYLVYNLLKTNHIRFNYGVE